MKTTRILSLLLILVMLVPMFAACGTGLTLNGDGETTTDLTTNAGLTNGSGEGSLNNNLVGSPTVPTPPATVIGYTYTPITDLGSYTIVYPEVATHLISDAAEELAAAILEETGATVAVESDLLEVGGTVPATGKEILLGMTNRAESASGAGLRCRDFFITYNDDSDRLVLLANTEEALLEAIEFAKTTLLRDGALTYIEEDYHKADEYFFEDLTLLGSSIRDFAIVRDRDNIAAANYLSEVIRDLTGYTIPVRTVQDAETACEILVGNTGRAATNAAVPAGKFAVTASGTKLALYGNGEQAAYRAVLHFINTYLNGTTANLAVTNTQLDTDTVALYTLNLPDELPTIEVESTLNNGGVLERFLKAKAELPTEVTVIDPVDLNDYPLSKRARQLYVDPNTGSDENPGTIDKPLATLNAAVDRMVAGGGVIWLREGTHEIHSAVKLTEKISGTPTSPLFIKAYGNEDVTVTTFKEIKNEWFQSLDPEDPMIDRFDEDVDLQYLLYCDLADYGFTKDDITEIVSSGDGYGVNRDSGRSGATPLLLIGGTEYNLARYPNADEPELAYATAYESGRVTGATGSEIYNDWLERVATSGETFEGKPLTNMSPIPWVISLGERNFSQQSKNEDNYVSYKASKNWERYAPVLEWIDTGNIWWYGRIYSDWDVGKYPVNVGIQPDTGTYACWEGDPDKPAIFSKMPSTLGATNRSVAGHGHEYYFFNAIEALDIPGEWFIDEESEGLRLYIYPPDEFYSVESFSYTGAYTGAAINIQSATNVVIDGIDFNGIGTTAIYHAATSPMIHDVVIQNCSFANMSHNGVSMYGSFRKVAVIYCSFSRSRGTMVKFSSEVAQNLEPDHNLIQNCTFGDPLPMMQEGIALAGCQSVISHNFLTNTNINLNGPAYECIVEYNRCDGGSKDVGDGGMVYMYGLYTRGCHTRYNVLHGANYTGNGIYNDGMCSGNYAYYNLVSFLTGYRNTAQKGFYVSTGHGNVAFNNIFIVRSWERVEENLTAHGYSLPSPLNTWTLDKDRNGLYMVRTRGDMAIHETTLFYADNSDAKYANSSGGSDSASYSWDRLYNGAAGKFTGRSVYKEFDIEKWKSRFPLFIEEMEGAYEMFRVMNAAGSKYDRRTAVLFLEAGYDAVVDIFTGEADFNFVEVYGDATHPLNGKAKEIKAYYEEYGIGEGNTLTETEAEDLAFRLGYAYTEDYFRQPAYNVYMNNVVLGGDAGLYFDNDRDREWGEEKRDFVNSDYIGSTGSYDDFGNAVMGGNAENPFAKDFRIIGENYYELDWDRVFVSCDTKSDEMHLADYTFRDGILAEIREKVPDFYDFVDLIWNRWKGKTYN